MAIRKQAKVIKALNKLTNTYRGLIKKREVPTLRREHHLRSFVNIRDLLLLIKDLLNSRKKQVVDFGLDLYIILLAGQRYLADHKKIENGIREMLVANDGLADEGLQLYFQMIIGKNDNPIKVCLNKQLVLLLKEFKWEKFNEKTYRLVQRMN